MTPITRYIDDPAQFLFWDLDEVMVISTLFGIGLMIDTPTLFIGMGVAMTWALKRVKRSRSEGYFLHFAYWAGVLKFRKNPRVPESWKRQFIE